MMRATIGGLVAALLLAGLGGCVNREAQSQAKRTQELINDPTRPVKVQRADTKDFSETLEITGDLTTAADVEVGPKQPGKIVSVFVKDGDTVAAGQLIATQDTSQLLSNYRQALAGVQAARAQLSQATANAAIGPSKSSAAVASAQAQLKSAQAALKKALAGSRQEERVQAEWQVKSAKSNLDTADKELERTRTLVEQGALARQRLEQAQNAYNAALAQYNAALQNQALVQNATRPEDIEVARESVRQAEEAVRSAKAQKQLDVLLTDQVRAAQAGVETAQAQVAIAKQALEDANIRAPFAGKIAGKPVQPGAVLGVGQPVARIIGSQGVYFEGQVPEENIDEVSVGKTVEVHVGSVDKTYAGHIAAVNPLGSQVGRLFSVRVQIDGGTDMLKPGMFARGVVTLAVHPNVTVIPSDAVITKNNETIVYVVENGKAKAVPVTLGLRKEQEVEVKGLPIGEEVIVQGQNIVSDGTPVKVEASNTAALKQTESGV